MSIHNVRNLVKQKPSFDGIAIASTNKWMNEYSIMAYKKRVLGVGSSYKQVIYSKQNLKIFHNYLLVNRDIGKCYFQRLLVLTNTTHVTIKDKTLWGEENMARNENKCMESCAH